MTRLENDIYSDLWQLEPPSIPERSRLFPLKPVGMGTHDVECLTGFITRLAIAHCVTTSKLLRREISPLMGIENLSFGAELKSLNGVTSLAFRAVKALETLTKLPKLHSLTMIVWAEVIPYLRLLKPYKAWCPLCYQQWLNNTQEIYEPLIWNLNVVEICPHHYIRLVTDCPHCSKKLYPLAQQQRPGYCSLCHSWLGADTVESIVSPQLKNSDRMWQTYVVENIGSLLAIASELSSVLPDSTIATAMSARISQLNQDELCDLISFIGHNHNVVKSWIQGIRIPQLNTLLKLCYFLDISLIDFLSICPEQLQEKQGVISKTINVTISKSIQDGMLKAKNWGVHIGRPQETENITEFLRKPKSQAVINALSDGLSLRKAAKRARVSVNTVRKVKALVQELKQT